MSTLAPLLQSFFTDRLIGQRRCSRHTITGYRTTFRLLLVFASDRTGKTPSALDIAELDAPLIGAFLDHLENQRGNQARTRNNRLAAIHSLFSYAALRHPEHAATIQRVLAIPTKRCDRNLVTWLTEAEVDALLSAPDRATWTGRRDHAMLVLAAQTGLRISELTGLTIADIHLDTAAYVHCFGKGRKERATPLTPLTCGCCGSGSPNAAESLAIRCSRPSPAGGSATTRSNTVSPVTSSPPARHAPHCGRNGLGCILFGIRRPCDCWNRERTSP